MKVESSSAATVGGSHIGVSSRTVTPGRFASLSVRRRTEDGGRELLKRRLREVANHREGIRKFRGPHQERITVGELLDNLVADYKQRGIKSLRQTVGENGKGGHMKPIRAHFESFKALSVTPDRIRQ